MNLAIPVFNPDYKRQDREYNSVQALSADKPLIFENNFVNKLNNDIDRLDFKANKQANPAMLPNQPSFIPAENPFIIDPSIKSDIDMFKTLKKDKNKFTAKFKDKNGAEQALLYALSPLPPARRIASLPDSIKLVKSRTFTQHGCC